VVRRFEQRHEVEAVFAVDVADPQVVLSRAEFVHADTRHSVIAKMVRELGIDTVLHMAVLVDVGGRAAHETNVIGTMNLLAACAGKGSPVRRLVVRSHAAVYGVLPDHPSFLAEEASGQREPRASLARDLREAEQLAHDFAVRNPGTTVTVLRLGHRLGSRRPTPLGRYFLLPRLPKVFGFDPRLQLLADVDAVDAVMAAVDQDRPGVYNVSGRGVVLLSQAAQLTGRRALSLLTPYAPALARLQLRALTGLALPPMYLDLLTYGQVLDCRKFESAFDWRPKLASREVIMEFVRRTRSGQAAEQTALVPHERELQSYLRSRGSA
jgi:UDP-glucose 4-epimerase